MLDNFPHIKTFWIMNTIEVSQIALWYGANDIDGTVMDYEITRRSFEETRQRLSRDELLDRIVEAGREPVERDSLYNVVGPAQGDRRGGRVIRVRAIADIAGKLSSGERLGTEDALRLFAHPNLAELGILANQVRVRKHPESVVTYNVGRNINYTNVCWVRCDFCAFYRPPGSDEGYVLPKGQIHAKIDELVAFGGTEPKSCEILMQGGLNPRLKLAYYEELLSGIRDRYPMVQLHCLSATEIIYIAHISRLSLEETIARLRAAGLDSIPGAGAEILDDGVRDVIGFRKDRSDEWLEVHRIAHGLGMAHHGDDDVRPRRDGRAPRRAHEADPRPAGRDRGIHRLHCLEFPAGRDGARGRPGALERGQGDRVRPPAYGRRGAPVPRQRRQTSRPRG